MRKGSEGLGWAARGLRWTLRRIGHRRLPRWARRGLKRAARYQALARHNNLKVPTITVFQLLGLQRLKHGRPDL